MMGAVPTPPRVTTVALIGQDLELTLNTLAGIYDTSARFLGSRPCPSVEYGERLWAEDHLTQLGYGLLGAVVIFLAALAWAIS